MAKDVIDVSKIGFDDNGDMAGTVTYRRHAMTVTPKGEHGLEHYRCTCGFTAQTIPGGAILPDFDEIHGRLHEAALDRSISLITDALGDYGIE